MISLVLQNGQREKLQVGTPQYDMKKVAFLNLSLHSFSQERVWEKFFSEGGKDSFNLYIHSKSKKECRFSDYYIDKSITTGWGHFSLVEATIELIKAALEDEYNEYFSLISDSHFPLYTLDKTISLVKDRYKKTTFAKHFSFHTKAKSQLTFREGVKNYKFDEYNAVCQFFILRRKDAIKFVETFDHWSKFFVKDKVIFADEFYFWGVGKEIGVDFEMGQATTYSDWSIRKDEFGKIERNPRAFKMFSSKMLHFCREKGFLYSRKIMPNTLITINPFI
jgi:hypothetical protein